MLSVVAPNGRPKGYPACLHCSAAVTAHRQSGGGLAVQTAVGAPQASAAGGEQRSSPAVVAGRTQQWHEKGVTCLFAWAARGWGLPTSPAVAAVGASGGRRILLL